MQPTLFPLTEPTGPQLRDIGIQKAVEHADAVCDKWSDKAYEVLKKYLARFESGHHFMGEQVRLFADTEGLPKPLSLRAWGGVMQRAAKEGLIKQNGTAKVNNPLAHCANAAKWMIV